MTPEDHQLTLRATAEPAQDDQAGKQRHVREAAAVVALNPYLRAAAIASRSIAACSLLHAAAAVQVRGQVAALPSAGQRRWQGRCKRCASCSAQT